MIYQTKIGQIEIKEQNGKITKLNFIKSEESEEPQKSEKSENPEELKQQKPNKNEATPLIKQTYQQIVEYLEGKRKEFNVPIQMQGTPFQIKVWQELQNIPYGQTRSYQDIANAVGNPKACRAVGMANYNNPIAIIVPCHRVIGKNKKLVGYAGGLDIKEKLLEIENEVILNEQTKK